MNIYFATQTTDISQNISLTKKEGNKRLLSFYYIGSKGLIDYIKLFNYFKEHIKDEN